MNWILNKRKEVGWIIAISFIISTSMYLLPTNISVKLFAGLAALVIILWRIELGLYMAVFAMPFVTFKYIALLIFYTFGCYIGKKIYKKQRVISTPIDGPLLLFFLVLIFSVLFSITLTQSIKEMFIYTSILLMVFMVSRELDKKSMNSLLMFMIISATFVALYGIYQYSVGMVGGHGWVDIETNPNLKARAYSTMENPNILAEYLVIITSMSVALFLDSKNPWRKLLLLCITGILSLCLVLTFSRGGWIAFAISMLIILIWEEKKMIPLVMMLGLFSLFFLPDVVLDRLKTIGNLKDTSNAYRFLIWSAAWEMLKDYWPSGVGLGYVAFMKAYPNYMLAGVKAAHAHNSYLQIAIETGIFGLLSFLYAVIKTYATGILVLLRSSVSFYKRITVAAMGVISGLLFHAIVEHVLFDYRVIFSLWMTIAIAIASHRGIDEGKHDKCRDDGGFQN